jgi:hypothetical protein
VNDIFGVAKNIGLKNISAGDDSLIVRDDKYNVTFYVSLFPGYITYCFPDALDNPKRLESSNGLALKLAEELEKSELGGWTVVDSSL